MEHLLELTAILVVCGTFVLLIWLMRGIMVTPVPTDENTELYMVVAVKGDGTNLEQTLQSLEWISDEGKIPMTLVVCDCGLTDNGKKLISRDKWDAVYCTPQHLGEIAWKKELTESEVQ